MNDETRKTYVRPAAPAEITAADLAKSAFDGGTGDDGHGGYASAT